MSSSIYCMICKKQRATKFCRACAPLSKLCAFCCADRHATKTSHAVKALCVDCFANPAAVECECCSGKICVDCIAQHVAVCNDEDPGHNAEDSESGSDSEIDVDAPLKARGGKRPGERLPKNAAAKKQKASDKVAEVIEPADVPRSAAAAAVDAKILERVKKALALGLHAGGNAAEKQHAMQRATRLMEQHGLTQADVVADADDIGKASGMVSVRLNGLFRRLPAWNCSVAATAENMTSTKSYYMYGIKPDPKVAVASRPLTMNFYGLRTQARMAAHVYEEAYNAVMHMSKGTYGGKGESAKMNDYRKGLAYGLYEISKQDRDAREAKLEQARLRLTAAPPLAACPSSVKAGRRGAGAPFAVRDANVHREALAGSGAAAKVDYTPSAIKEEEAGDGAWDDAGWDGDWQEDWANDYAGESGVRVQPQQLIQFQDKAKLAVEHQKNEMTFKLKARKKTKTVVKDWSAYSRGRSDAKTVNLGAKKLA